MSKKRVHELAKELGLDNNVVLHALQAAGISVKTHSSSVYEEEALSVLNKMKGAPAVAEPQATAAAARRPGMMIVKKKKADPEAEALNESAYDDSAHVAETDTHEYAAHAEPTHSYEEPAQRSSHDESFDVDARAPIAESTPSELEASAPRWESERAPEAPVEPTSDFAAHEQVSGAAEPQHSEQPTQHGVSATQHDTSTHASAQKPHQAQDAHKEMKSDTQPSSTPHHQDASHSTAPRRHEAPTRPSENAGAPKQAPTTPAAPPTAAAGTAPKRPPGTSATVVRMIDRDKLMERIPQRRLGGQGGQGQGGRPGGPGGRPGGNYQQRPGGPGGARPGPQGAGGPGNPRYGQVTELRVVTDPFGRGREMVQVGKDKKKTVGPSAPPAPMGKVPPKKTLRGTPAKRAANGAEIRERSMYPARLKKKKSGKTAAKRPENTQPKASKRIIKMKETIVVADLAHQLGIKSVDVLRKLMALGVMVTQNQSIDFDTAQLIATELEYTVESVAFAEKELFVEADAEEAANPEKQISRPPVVTIMGHVDHGKTSLLDAIRKARVAAGEAGGITQHIGAYSIEVPGKGMVTFLDTPGHAAFTQMRARGAQVTDIVVLVVAADDGVMPQTEEAIKHAQAAKVPIIVAVNKCDKPDANPDRVMQELTKYELLSEAWGGQTIFINTSATKGTGIQELLESILLQAEVLELTANPNRAAAGVVIEAQLDKGRGPVATVLIAQGTLKRGDSFVVGEHAGRVRAMTDDQGRQVSEAGPSCAVEVIGLEGVPEAGDKFNAVETPEAARDIAAHRQSQKRASDASGNANVSLEDLMKRMSTSDQLELKVVLKADVQGSVEAVKHALLKLSTDEVKVNVIYGGVGAIKESDIMLASASKGIVLGFNVRPDTNARIIGEREGVDVRTYNIIYEAVDEIRKAMEGLLSPESREKIIGRAEVREMFRITKVGVIAGCRVVDGKAMRSARVRVLRDNVQKFDGKVSSLRHFKSDVREVDSGLECGIGVEGYNDLKLGDVIEFYMVEEFARTLAVQPVPGKRGSSNEARP